MAKLSRTKEIWHIPKRGNVHQTIYMVYVLSWEKFLNKSWSSGKQESLGSEMGKAGLTESGKAITHQSVRTLLANLPKYLGFVFIDESSVPAKIMVTEIGYELIKHHKIDTIPKHRNIHEYEISNDLVTISEIFKKQMLKLIITNPIILNDCEKILVFPFRFTLKLLLELEYLDKEEIGYILFRARSEDEFDLVKERIKNFRKLDPHDRTREIEQYEKTNEGQLTLVKAPSSGYYSYLCYSTGLCKRMMVNVNKIRKSKIPAIKIVNKEETIKLLSMYDDVKIYDFKDNWFLWKEYFSNPRRIFPPFNIKITSNSSTELLVIVNKDNKMIASDVLSSTNIFFLIPVFRDEKYEFIIYDLEKGNQIDKKYKIFSHNDENFLLNINQKIGVTQLSKDHLSKQIEGMFTGQSGFDKEYHSKLETLNAVIGKNFIDNRRKGGRLEYLFYELLTILKNEKIIDEVFWYGTVGRFGICEPAPGGKDGNPDLVFEIDDYLFVLELTTIRGIRAQWNSSEASSVPDHIIKCKDDNTSKKIIGIFCAPSIHHQLEKNLTLNAKKEKIGIIFEPCIEFAKYLSSTTRKDLKTRLVEKSISQLNSV